MKQLLLVIALLFMAAVACVAEDVNLTWDAMPAGQAWENVRIYEVVGSSYNQVAEVLGTETVATIPDVSIGDHIYIARSYQAGNESSDSNQVITEIDPAEPSNFRIITVNIDDDGNITFRLVDPAEFFRT